MTKSNFELSKFLGTHMSGLLTNLPFSGWAVARTVDEYLPTKHIWYEFEGHGVEVICDEDDQIRTIFLHRGDGEALSGVAFSLSRREILDRFGVPSKSGCAVHIPALGEKGAWDRFKIPTGSIHVQYRLDRDEIDLITLMRRDVEP